MSDGSLPKQGSFIYVEQVSPARAFVGRVVLIWTGEDGREVIAVVDDEGETVNLAEDDKWVPHKTPVAPFVGLGFWFDPGTEYVQDRELIRSFVRYTR
jgi:hypothetical protein